MVIKLILLILLFINLGLPTNQPIDIFFIIFGIIILFFSKNIAFKSINKNKFIYIMLILSIANFFIPKFIYNEAHSIFLTNKDIKIVSNFLPFNVSKEIKNDFNTNFDFERFVDAADWDKSVHSRTFIKKPYAFSVDNYFHNSQLSRKNSEINFRTREDLRIGQINSLKYGWAWDTPLRRILPYYVFFEIPQYFGSSEICKEGKVFYKFSNKKLDYNNINILNFEKLNNDKCLKIDNTEQYLYILGYSINENDNLSIKLKNNFLSLIKYFKYLLNFLFLILLLKIYKLKISTNLIIYLVSTVSTILLAMIRDPNTILGLRYFRGGADGIVHYSWSREIIENLYLNNYVDALKGSEDIFYFMPGLRYFGSINNILFGETILGYLILCTFIPFVFYKIFELLFSRKVGIIFTISFIFIPILENMGLGHFNFIWNFARFHAEPIAILLFLSSLYFIIRTQFNNSVLGFFPILLISASLALSVFLRPNYFPSSLILFFYLIYFLFNKKKYFLIFSSCFGYLLIFICISHNLFFGKEAYLFTKSAVNFNLPLLSFFDAIFSIISFNFQNENLSILISQLKIWNPLYNLHRLVMILFILYIFLKRIQPSLNYVIFLCAFSQHGLLLLTHPGGRYSYFAWILTFLLFTLIFRKPNKGIIYN